MCSVRLLNNLEMSCLAAEIFSGWTKEKACQLRVSHEIIGTPFVAFELVFGVGAILVNVCFILRYRTNGTDGD